MITSRTLPLAAGKQHRRSIGLQTLATRPPHPLANLLINQLLPARLPRPPQHDLLPRVQVPIRHDDGILLVLHEHRGPSLPRRDLLGLGPLLRVALALLAEVVPALGALLGGAEEYVALVALAVHAHADRLLDAQHVALKRVVPGSRA